MEYMDSMMESVDSMESAGSMDSMGSVHTVRCVRCGASFAHPRVDGSKFFFMHELLLVAGR